MIDAEGMKGLRARDITGPLRTKRGDTLTRTIERNYGVNFHVRGDMKLVNLLRKTGYSSLKKLLNHEK